MDALQFFREQHDLVRSIVNGMVLAGLSDDQMRTRPRENQNSLVWLLWHTARWEDFAMTVLDESSVQVLNENDWHERMNICRRRGGTGMTPEECAEFNTNVDVAGVGAYWDEVGSRSRAWYLSFANWHAVEHLFGEALSVRGQEGIPLGL